MIAEQNALHAVFALFHVSGMHAVQLDAEDEAREAQGLIRMVRLDQLHHQEKANDFEPKHYSCDPCLFFFSLVSPTRMLFPIAAAIRLCCRCAYTPLWCILNAIELEYPSGPNFETK